MMKRNKYGLAVRLAFFGAAVATAVWLLMTGRYLWSMVPAGVAALAVWQTLRLFAQGGRKATFMFDSIANGDYSFRFD